MQVREHFCRNVEGEAGVCPKSRQVVIVRKNTKNKNISLPTLSLPVCLQTACRQPAKRLCIPKKRETRFELATACLEGRNSTTELLPHNRGARTRTADLLLPKQARYQLRHTPFTSLTISCYQSFVKHPSFWLLGAILATITHLELK